MLIFLLTGGTGNGLVKSILYESKEEYSALNASFVAVKGASSPLDLSLVKTKTQTYQAFLILGWGLIADVDILSETMRWMGEARLYVAAVRLIAAKNMYAGRLSFLSPPKSLESMQDLHIPPLEEPVGINGDGWTVISDEFIFVWVLQTTHCSAHVFSAPTARLDDGVFTIIVGRNLSRIAFSAIDYHSEVLNNFDVFILLRLAYAYNQHDFQI